jgi:hypothetical protein
MPFRSLFAAVLLALGAEGVVCAAGPPAVPRFDPDKPLSEAERKARLECLQVNQSPDEILRLLGPPQHVARQILSQRCREQWVYDQAFQVRLEFDCPPGKKEPRLLSVPLANPGPP